MPVDTCPDFLDDGSSAARRCSLVLTVIAAAALAGNCLLSCPSRFSEKHLQDRTLLAPVITALSLGGRFPTARGVEVRSLIFHIGAACLAVAAGLRLMTARGRPRLSMEDLVDYRARAASPCFWWLLLVVVSLLSSLYSHAPDICRGQTILRFLQLAWWWPLAALLDARHVRALVVALVGVLGLTAAIGLWYHVARVLPDAPAARLQYPIGNELWLAACLLPGVFLAVAIPLSSRQAGAGRWVAAVPAVAVLLAALALTRSRSALIGLAAGGVVVLFMACRGRARRVLALAAVLAALGAAAWLQRQRSHGAVAHRAHSIRTRLNYDWPYALHLFTRKPIAGHGDGAYALLAGQFAREDQLDDPGTIRFDETSWTAHAHNEPLELLSDVGLVGMIAFSSAIGLTLWRALRACDRMRGETSARRDRRLAMGLAGALAAMVVEECGDSALREPGLPAVFFTVWAALWAMVRRHRPPPNTGEGDLRPGRLSVALIGAAVCVAGAWLGRAAVGDWQAARARHEAGRCLEAGRFREGIDRADAAAAGLLDPFQQCLARMIGIWSRSLAYDAVLSAGDSPPADAEMRLSDEALVRLNQLAYDAPRFLRLSRLEAELHLNRARAFERRGDRASSDDSRRSFIQALRRSREDEPFLLERVEALWKADGSARTAERLLWLRCLIRNGEIDDGFLALFAGLARVPDARAVLEELYSLAVQDESRPVASWQDRLSPETLRLVALARMLAGRPEDAREIAGRAERMYARAGPRLFAAHSAALHEMARYRFAQDPSAGADECLDLLARAEALLGGVHDVNRTLVGPLGETRLLVLVAGGRRELAEAQALRLEKGDTTRLRPRLAQAFVDVAGRYASGRLRCAEALAFARRAAEFDPTLADAEAIALACHLSAGDEDAALAAARRFLALATHRATAKSFLARLRERHPASGLWQRLEVDHPDVAPPPASQPLPHPGG